MAHLWFGYVGQMLVLQVFSHYIGGFIVDEDRLHILELAIVSDELRQQMDSILDWGDGRAAADLEQVSAINELKVHGFQRMITVSGEAGLNQLA